MSSGFSNPYLRRFAGLGSLERKQHGCPGDSVLVRTLHMVTSQGGHQPGDPRTFPKAPPSLMILAQAMLLCKYVASLSRLWP